MLTDTRISEWRNAFTNSFAIQQQTQLIKLLSDPSSLKMLYILVNDDLVCPTDFSDILGITPAAISFHLAKMKQLGIVQTVRNGQNVCYSLAKTREGRRLILLIKELSAKA